MDVKKRLMQYSSLSTGVVGLSLLGNAQVIYTDINPDAVYNLDGTGISLDLNNDVTPDFGIHLYFSTGSNFSKGGVYIFANGSNLVEYSSAPGGIYSQPYKAVALNLNSLIDSSGNFKSHALLAGLSTYITYSTIGGLWLGVTDKYLSLKFSFGGNTYYGWARLDVAADAKSFTIKDYAYESTPDVGIYAGSTNSITAVSAIDKNTIKVWCANNQLFFNNVNNIEISSMELYNSIGELSQKFEISSLNSPIQLSGLSNGIYLLHVNTNEGQISKKIYIHN